MRASRLTTLTSQGCSEVDVEEVGSEDVGEGVRKMCRYVNWALRDVRGEPIEIGISVVSTSTPTVGRARTLLVQRFQPDNEFDAVLLILGERGVPIGFM